MGHLSRIHIGLDGTIGDGSEREGSGPEWRGKAIFHASTLDRKGKEMNGMDGKALERPSFTHPQRSGE